MPKLNPQSHTHQIRVETEAEQVHVTIGEPGEAREPQETPGGVAGGFAKFFNRVVDCGAWSQLSDAARAAYMPLVRFADHRQHFRVRIGHAALMKHSGLSRSSVKRAVKELAARRLLVVIGQGGVSAEGQNECNLYQLLVPERAEGRSTREPGVSPLVTPEGVQSRPPSRVNVEPPRDPLLDPGEGRLRTAPGGHPSDNGGATGGPQLRLPGQETNSKTPSAAAFLLAEKGVDPDTSRTLAARFDYDRIADVIETMEYRQARGRCDNPGGFIREALLKQWETPRAVLQARQRAEAQRRQEEARARQEAAQQQARRDESEFEVRARQEEQRVERLVEALDDEELALLAADVLRKYQDNPTVLQVLTRRAPRESRLMRMEIAGLLNRSGTAR